MTTLWRNISIINGLWTIYAVYTALDLLFWIPLSLGAVLCFIHYAISGIPQEKYPFKEQCADRFVFYFGISGKRITRSIPRPRLLHF
jgi:MFS superfamily sulfate permease-like transporter